MLGLPKVGLGLWKATKEGEARSAVATALRCGYKLLDGAAAYGNEAEVGEARGARRGDPIVVARRVARPRVCGEQALQHGARVVRPLAVRPESGDTGPCSLREEMQRPRAIGRGKCAGKGEGNGRWRGSPPDRVA